VAATHESVLGTISVRWERQPASAVRLTVSVPVQSTMILPASDGTGIREGGKPAQRSPGVRSLRVEDGLAHIEVESGEYVFEAFL
jgi:alpha-L-rhamnosidase